LWEFIDDMDCVNEFQDGLYIGRCDDDGNGRLDLADSWSTPTIGRIRVIPPGDTEPVDKYVAIFGGGMDADSNGQSDAGGNFIYMVDMETGRAIYKRPVVGSAMADMAAVDTNQDGYLDTIYIAGSFGRFLDIEQAVFIGMVPDVPHEKYRYLGNSSLTGSYMSLVSREHRRRQLETAGRMTNIELSTEPEYMDRYTAALFLPHTDLGLFPSHETAGTVPGTAETGTGKRK